MDLARTKAEQHMEEQHRMELVAEHKAHLDLRTVAADMAEQRQVVDLGHMAQEQIHSRQLVEHRKALAAERMGSGTERDD